MFVRFGNKDLFREERMDILMLRPRSLAYVYMPSKSLNELSCIS